MNELTFLQRQEGPATSFCALAAHTDLQTKADSDTVFMDISRSIGYAGGNLKALR